MNLLQGYFDQTDASGFAVVFHIPALRLATGAPPMVLDFGDGSPTWTADATGMVKHVYVSPGGAQPWITTAVLTDADGVVRGQQRFEIPGGQYRPWDASAAGV